jgi:protein ImuB
VFGCVYLPNFLCQSVLRQEPELSLRPVAIVVGVPPQTRVIAVNSLARRKGLFTGMTKTEAEGYRGAILRDRSAAFEIAAHAALLDCAGSFSPRIEDVSPDTVVLDLSGLQRLMGTPEEIAHSIRDHARSLSLHARVGIGANIDAAVFAARSTRNIQVIPQGKELEVLEEVPISILDLEPATAETFRRWGIRNFGQLAALPATPLAQRLGQEGLRLLRAVKGQSFRVLSPAEAPQEFLEVMELEYSVADIESLSFVMRVMIDQLCSRLAFHALATAELRIELGLDTAHEDAVAAAGAYTRFIRLPVPTTDSKLLLRLLQLDLAAHPPGAPVERLLFHAEPTPPQHVQEGLFTPQGPEPQQLEITLARLRKLVGDGRVGSPEVIEQHTTDSFRLRHFTPSCKPGPRPPAQKAALRVYRPHRPAVVHSSDGAPVFVQFAGRKYRVWQSAGPWRRSGIWWTHRWGRDEWDLVLTQDDGPRLVVKAFRDLISRKWFIEGQYD